MEYCAFPNIMCPQAQLTGLHSRSEELIELTRSYDRGRVSWAEVENQLRQETRQLVQLQESLGFEYVSDGALSWQDPLRPLTRSFAGVTSGTRYSRWFDTNTFYQKPIVAAKVTLDGFKIQDFLQTELLPKTGKWKVSIPGPYTFSELSENRYYRDKSDLVLDVANAQREVVKKLAAAGVSLVQLSEPCLVYRPYREDHLGRAEIDLALRGIRQVVEGVQARFLVQSFFGDATPVITSLLDLPVEAVGFDLYETDYSKLHVETTKDLVLGIVDSRESHIEDPRWIAETALRATKFAEAREVTLAPNSDLKFLPRPTADKKATVLAEAVRILKEAS